MKIRKAIVLKASGSILTFLLLVNILNDERIQAQETATQLKFESTISGSNIIPLLTYGVICFSLLISIFAMACSLVACRKANNKQPFLFEKEDREKKRRSTFQSKKLRSFRDEVLDDQEYVDNLQHHIINRNASISAKRYQDYLEVINQKLKDPNISNLEQQKLTKLKKGILRAVDIEVKNASILGKEGKEDSIRKLDEHLQKTLRNRRERTSSDSHPSEEVL